MLNMLKSKTLSILLATLMLGGGLFVVQSAVDQDPAQAAARCYLDHWDHLDSYAASATIKNKSTTYVPCRVTVVSRCTFWGNTVYYDYSSTILLYPKYTPYNPWRVQNLTNSCYPYIRASSWVNIQYIWV